MPALEAAIRQCDADAAALSARVSAHTRDNVPKEKSLAALLDDAQVNALARTYLGKDFAFARRDLVGRIETQRRLYANQRRHFKPSALSDSELSKKVKELERRRSMLTKTITVGAGSYDRMSWQDENNSSRRGWLVEMDDIDSQLHYLRGLEWGRRFGKENVRDAEKKSLAHADMLNEKAVFETVSGCEQSTIGLLAATIDAQRAALCNEVASLARWRAYFAYVDFWPVNLLPWGAEKPAEGQP